jgi:DNA-binding NarL/FixJ family response regulator
MKMKSQTEPPVNPKRIFLVDHFPIVRLAVAHWLKQTPDLILCGEADNATNALEAVEQLKPDIVVTEILRQQDLGFIRNLHQEHPRLPILVFSFRDETWYAPLALAAGADGYLMKGVTIAQLVEGIRRMLDGRLVLSQHMRALMLSKCVRRGRRSLMSEKTRGVAPPPHNRN